MQRLICVLCVRRSKREQTTPSLSYTANKRRGKVNHHILGHNIKSNNFIAIDSKPCKDPISTSLRRAMSDINQDSSELNDAVTVTTPQEEEIIPDATSDLSEDEILKEEGEKDDDRKEADADENMQEASEEAPTEVKDEIDEEARRKDEEERKERWKDYPLKGIDEPHDNDVLFGRGGQYCFRKSRG